MKRYMAVAAAVLAVAVVLAAAFLTGLFPGTGAGRVTVNVSETVQDEVTAPPGSTYYMLSVKVAYTGGNALRIGLTDFAATDNSGAVYRPTSEATTVKTPFPATFTLSKSNQTVNGQIVFTFPLFSGGGSPAPATLQYTNPATGARASTAFPPVTRWVSVFTSAFGFVDYVGQGQVETLAAVRLYPISPPGWFYTGDQIPVRTAVYAAIVSSTQPNIVGIRLLLDDRSNTALVMSGLSPTLPVQLIPKTPVRFNFTAAAPAFSYFGAYMIFVDIGV